MRTREPCCKVDTTEAESRVSHAGEGGVEDRGFEVVASAAIVGHDDACSATLRFAIWTALEPDTAQAVCADGVVCCCA